MIDDGDEGGVPALSARFIPDWSYIEPLRTYVDLYARSCGKISSADGAGIVVHELLENAIKYGNPESEIELEVRLVREGRELKLCVLNKAQPARLAVLESELARTRSSKSGDDAFAQALQRVPRLPRGTTMLGLSRICLVATLDAKISGNRVLIVARIT
jgi:signal transduction histidine kinase